MIWKGTHLFIYGPTVGSVCQSKNQAMRSKELSIELWDRIVSRHRSGEGHQNISSALKVLKNTGASIILKWKKFGTTKTLPRAGHPAKLINQGRGPCLGGDQEPDGHSEKATEFLCGDGRTVQKDNHLCSTPPIRPLWLEWPDGRHFSVKGTAHSQIMRR